MILICRTSHRNVNHNFFACHSWMKRHISRASRATVCDWFLYSIALNSRERSVIARLADASRETRFVMTTTFHHLNTRSRTDSAYSFNSHVSASSTFLGTNVSAPFRASSSSNGSHSSYSSPFPLPPKNLRSMKVRTRHQILTTAAPHSRPRIVCSLNSDTYIPTVDALD